MLGKLFFLLLAVLGIGMAVPQTRAKMTEAAAPVLNGFKAKLVPARLEAMADQLDVRLGRGEGFPANWEGWLNRDFSSAPTDPWGNLYFLQSGRGSYTVGSKGPDGVENTADDIKVTRQVQR